MRVSLVFLFYWGFATAFSNPGGCPVSYSFASSQEACKNIECVISEFLPAPAFDVDTGLMYPPETLGLYIHASQKHDAECGYTHIAFDLHHYGGWYPSGFQDTAERILKYACPNTAWKFQIPAPLVVVPGGSKQTWKCPDGHGCILFYDADKAAQCVIKKLTASEQIERIPLSIRVNMATQNIQNMTQQNRMYGSILKMNSF